MKTLTFKKKEIIEPLVINKEEVVRFSKEENINILLNGIGTHIIGSKDLLRYDSDNIKDCIKKIIIEVISNKKSHELAFDGQHSISITDYGDVYVVRMYKTSPIYVSKKKYDELKEKYDELIDSIDVFENI